eukprot:3022514-Prymnesium_polylepis.1
MTLQVDEHHLPSSTFLRRGHRRRLAHGDASARACDRVERHAAELADEIKLTSLRVTYRLPLSRSLGLALPVRCGEMSDDTELLRRSRSFCARSGRGEPFPAAFGNRTV